MGLSNVGMTQDEINSREWNNSSNWTAFTYRSVLDSRVFVPKRKGVGVTINFGRKNGTLTLIVIIAAVALPGMLIALFYAIKK